MNSVHKITSHFFGITLLFIIICELIFNYHVNESWILIISSLLLITLAIKYKKFRAQHQITLIIFSYTIIGLISLIYKNYFKEDQSMFLYLSSFCLLLIPLIKTNNSSLNKKVIYNVIDLIFLFIVLVSIFGFTISHEIVIAIIFGLSLSICEKKYFKSFLYMIFLIVYLSYRPSSTIYISILSTLLMALIYQSKKNWIILITKLSILATFIFSILSIFYFQVLLGLSKNEKFLKEIILDGKSNNEFRLAIISSLKDTDINSIIFGNYFMEGIVVYNIQSELPWWQSNTAPIHSDFLIFYNSGGLIGLISFLFLLYKLVPNAKNINQQSKITNQEIGFCFCIANIIIFSNFNPMFTSIESMIIFTIILYLRTDFFNMQDKSLR